MQIELAKMLLETRQTHMFEHWAEPGVEDDEKKPSLIRGSTKTLGNFVKFLLLGVVPFPKDVPRLKQLGVGGVITLNEPCETLVPTSFYLHRRHHCLFLLYRHHHNLPHVLHQLHIQHHLLHHHHFHIQLLHHHIPAPCPPPYPAPCPLAPPQLTPPPSPPPPAPPLP
ncbi:hypothetical protein ACB098_07G094800 [Castanea mollissima]